MVHLDLASKLAALAFTFAACLAADGSPVAHRLYYRSPAADSIVGWERESLPLGCGHFGWNVFGIAANERVQVTHNAVMTKDNLTNALEIRIETPVSEISNYERSLDLEEAVAYVSFDADGVRYRREYFTSYPDRVGVIRLSASKRGALSFAISAEVPFLRSFGDAEGRGRRGEVSAKGSEISVRQELEFYDIKFGASFRVEADGRVEAGVDGRLRVSGATEASVFFSCDTNYKLCPGAFTGGRKKPEHSDGDPLARSAAATAAAAERGYTSLRAAHVADYRSLAGRVKIDIGADAQDAVIPTPELLARYRKGGRSAYLEETHFLFGRYLLISSSRPGTLPANLQGVWTGHDKSPWGAGYWYNINVQMNYWPAFSTNLGECFRALADYDAAWRPQTRQAALGYLRRHALRGEGADDGESPDIWCVGTANRPYSFSTGIGGHSGPGTGGLTAKLYFDWWEFTRDREVLERHAYPVLHGMADFLSQCVREYDGVFLTVDSASPEQMIGGRYTKGGKCYHTVGCAFDQQMVAECGRDFETLRRALGRADDAVSKRIRSQAGRYDHVLIGWSGQVKEYREEGYYGSFCEWHHRHISHLMALMPGNAITRDTPAWLDAAKVALDKRGDKSTGWALAHRLCAWARALDGERAHRLLSNLLSERTYDNLWDAHPPYQIDGNLGSTAGVAEMLLQSHAGAIDLLPALPSLWARHGSFSGLRARGGYTVDCEWRDGAPVRAVVRADRRGETPKVRFGGSEISASQVDGTVFLYASFQPRPRFVAPPSDVTVDRAGRTVRWRSSPEKGVVYRVLRNTRSAPGYDIVADDLSVTECADAGIDFAAEDYVTYKVVAVAADGAVSAGALHTCSRATDLEKDRYILQARNIGGETVRKEELD